jgi:radical SAM protein with 4Fe4S-binding SPASM domain
MTPDEFSLIIEKIRPFTDYIYLHVLGEPLLHPQLEKILTIAETAGMNINMTTNGGLLERKNEILLNHSLRQINISLHDAEENIVPEKWEDYLNSVFDFALVAAPNTYVSLRLWNITSESSNEFNSFCLKKISEKFNLSEEALVEKTKGNGLKLAEHIFLQQAPRFEWPDQKIKGTQTQKNCYALRDHIAILSDGQVIPCCLDADANMKLGNIFTEELSDMLETKRAKDIKKGFEQRKIVEPICASCGFIID